MPHRESDFVTRCDQCETPASSSCIRCGRPCCEDHAPLDEMRCAACELEWERRALLLPVPQTSPVDTATPYLRWAVLPTLAIMFVVAIGTAILMGDLAMGVLLGVLIGSVLSVPLFGMVSAALLGTKVKRALEPVHARLRTRTSRRAFLAERGPRRALRAPGFGEPEEPEPD